MFERFSRALVTSTTADLGSHGNSILCRCNSYCLHGTSKLPVSIKVTVHFTVGSIKRLNTKLFRSLCRCYLIIMIYISQLIKWREMRTYLELFYFFINIRFKTDNALATFCMYGADSPISLSQGRQYHHRLYKLVTTKV